MSDTVIWKYQLQPGRSEMDCESSRPPVHVGLDPAGTPSIWLEITPNPDRRRTLRLTVVGTGHTIPADAGEHVGSFTDGPFVWHVYAHLVPA